MSEKPERIDPKAFKKALDKQLMERTLKDLINPPAKLAHVFGFEADPNTGIYKASTFNKNLSFGAKYLVPDKKT